MELNRMIYSVDQLTPKNLTDILLEKKFLLSGEVVSFDITSSCTTPVSDIYRIYVQYSADFSGEASNRLFLKIPKTNLETGFLTKLGKKEIKLYNSIKNNVPIPICYGASYNSSINRYYILLEDLSEHFIEAEWPIPPFMWQCEKAVDSLAKIHAKYWDHQYLEELEQYLVDQSLFKINSTCLDSFRLSFFDKKLNEDLLKYHVSQTQNMYQEFKYYLGDRLSKERQYIYEKVIDNLPLILKRTTKKLNVTLIHGDAHLWNFLYPLDNREYCRLADWQTWDVNIGTEDLSHMIALHWFPKRRALYEGRLIRRYHEQLIINGVKTYSLDDVWNDYRLSVIRKIFLPMRQWYSGEVSPQVWWNHLERIFLAFDDLNCLMRLEQRD